MDVCNIAAANNAKHKFSFTTQMAGKNCLLGFNELRSHPLFENQKVCHLIV
jgi:hypothetical protein